jgi:hypothetical protein
MQNHPPNVTTASGNLPDVPYGEGTAPGYLNPETGMYSDYWVLSEAERTQGFVRPLRRSYRHKSCGEITSMGEAIAETYARDPKFYGATFCATCREHFAVCEFVWVLDGTEVGA